MLRVNEFNLNDIIFLLVTPLFECLRAASADNQPNISLKIFAAIGRISLAHSCELWGKIL